MPVEHQPTYYLSDEASELRIAALVRRIATEGLRPGESVPARILAMAESVRAGEVEFVRAAA